LKHFFFKDSSGVANLFSQVGQNMNQNSLGGQSFKQSELYNPIFFLYWSIKESSRAILKLLGGQKWTAGPGLATPVQVNLTQIILLILRLLNHPQIASPNNRNEVKGAGLQDTKENCWRFFIDRVRRQLKVTNNQLSERCTLNNTNYFA